MKIALVSEGNYPFAISGVSTWCDQMIRGLPEHRWTMVALTVDGRERPAWAAPDNVDSFEQIPLWTPSSTGPRRSGRVRRPGAPRRPGSGFASAYHGFLAAMLTPADPRSDQAMVLRSRFLLALRGMFEYATRGGDLSGALTSNAALAQLTSAWRDIRGGDLALADAVEAANLLDHMLRPLSAPPVRCDIVHASMNGLSMLVAMAAKWRYGTPLVLSEQGIYLRERYLAHLDEKGPRAVRMLILSFFRALAGASYLIADAVAPHSSHNRRWQLHNGADPDRMWTMYNGVEPADFPVAPAEPDRPTVVFLGRITPLKDLHTLIRSFIHVRAKVPDARLRIFGATAPIDEAYGAGCHRLIHDLSLTGVATMEGPVESAVTAYHAATIVALTSVSEGFPHSVVEAMACGRPMVCTNVGGVAEAVADAGIVVAPRDPVAIGQACVTLLHDEELRQRMGTAARSRVLELFTLESSLDAYRGVYDHLADTAAQHTLATIPLPLVPQSLEPMALVPQSLEPRALVPTALASQPSVPQPSVPQPSVPQPSVPPSPVPPPSVPQPSVPQPSVPQPRSVAPVRPLSPARLDRARPERRPRALGRARIGLDGAR